jgi:hypothetical protein
MKTYFINATNALTGKGMVMTILTDSIEIEIAILGAQGWIPYLWYEKDKTTRGHVTQIKLNRKE